MDKARTSAPPSARGQARRPVNPETGNGKPLASLARNLPAQTFLGAVSHYGSQDRCPSRKVSSTAFLAGSADVTLPVKATSSAVSYVKVAHGPAYTSNAQGEVENANKILWRGVTRRLLSCACSGLLHIMSCAILPLW